jgi:hypothetical protein
MDADQSAISARLSEPADRNSFPGIERADQQQHGRCRPQRARSATGLRSRPAVAWPDRQADYTICKTHCMENRPPHQPHHASHSTVPRTPIHHRFRGPGRHVQQIRHYGCPTARPSRFQQVAVDSRGQREAHGDRSARWRPHARLRVDPSWFAVARALRRSWNRVDHLWRKRRVFWPSCFRALLRAACQSGIEQADPRQVRVASQGVLCVIVLCLQV